MVNPVRDPETGTTYLEMVLCTAVAAVLLGGLFTGLAGNARAVRESLGEAAAGRAASSRLEVLRADRGSAAPGRRAFELDAGASELLPGARGEEEVEEVRPGLLAVAVRVTWRGAGGDERTVRLASLLAREGGR